MVKYEILKAGAKRFTFDYVKFYIESQGYKLVSNAYISGHKLLDMICPVGHTYQASFSSFKRGTRCSTCKGNKRLSIDDVKAYTVSRGTSLVSSIYKNISSTLNFECVNGHIFSTTLASFKASKNSCPICSTSKLTLDEVKTYIESFGYKLLSMGYTNNKEYLDVQCNKGHVYKVTYANFQLGYRCPYCSGSMPKYEQELADWLGSLGIKYLLHDRALLNPYEIDLFLPDYGIGIELGGLYWHSYNKLLERMPSAEAKNYHKFKADLANEKGIRLIQIFEDEWLFKKNNIKGLILNAAGKGNTRKLNARASAVRVVDFKSAKEFLSKWHVGGPGFVGELRYGLYVGNELVSLLTFTQRCLSKGKAKLSSDEYELYKFCSCCNVRGGLQKLLKYFETQCKPKLMRTYIDRRFFTGTGFYQAGFKLDHMTKPNYFYFMRETTDRFHRFSMRKNWAEPVTECERRLQEGYYKIYDAGHLCLIKYDYII